MNKAFYTIALLVAGIFGVAGLAGAKGIPGIKYTVHNMSKDNPYGAYYAANEDEICIFCHTPHGGSLTGPLWNRPTADTLSIHPSHSTGSVNMAPAGYFTHYTSATMTPSIASQTGRALSDVSLLCMTCHDGTIATNRVLNVSNRTTPWAGNETIGIETAMGGWSQLQPTMDFPPKPGPVIGTSDAMLQNPLLAYDGGDLSDDHPVSFNYNTAQTDASNTGTLRTLADAQTAGVRFFNGNMVECSTCHDPHVDYGDSSVNSPNQGNANYTKFTPFLYKSNENSNLCFACHIK